MAQSLSRVLVHLVFSTKNRHPFLSVAIRPQVHAYLAGVLRSEKCPVIQVGDVEDHVHILFDNARTLCLSDAVQKVKTSSSLWVKGAFPGCRDFAWQNGYAAFSVGVREEEKVVAYIRRQEEHHHGAAFKEELLALLTENKVKFDEQYLWD